MTEDCLRINIFSSLPMCLTPYDFLCSPGRIVFLSRGGDADQQTQQYEPRAVGYY